MAGESGTTTDPVTPLAASRAQSHSRADLLRALEESPFKFDFFQAVRRIESSHRHMPRVGHATHASDDPVRFGQVATLAFAPSTLADFKPSSDDGVPRLAVHFFGLLGANGPMPTQFTEHVRDRELNHGDETVARFLDVFHHRMTSLFYRAWACNQQTVSHDRAGDGDGDRWAAYVGSLIGIGMESFASRDAVPDVAKLHYSGRLASHTRNAEGLEAIIADYLQIDTELKQFVGQWLSLPSEAGCRLGGSRDSGTLGQTVVVGSRVWDCTQKFRVRLGAMTFAEYERMLPGGKSLIRLVAWVKNYVGDELEWDAQLVLKKEEIPQLRLGQVGKLGWSTWVRSKPMPRDADDLVLRPKAA